MKTITSTNARTKLYELVKRSAKAHEMYRITSKEGSAVLLSEEDYDSMLETLELLSTPGVLEGVRHARKEIAKGQTYSMKEVFGK